MIAIASDDGLCGLEFAEPASHARLAGRLRRRHPRHEIRDDRGGPLDQAAIWLRGYLDGDLAALTAPTLDLIGTDFERRVWRALLAIPAGAIATYGDVAAEVACSSARAI